MASFIHISSRYDLRISPLGNIEIICTHHEKRAYIVAAFEGTVGVDTVVRMIESHENQYH